jgi:3-oxoadipate enol-lactonase
MIAGQRTTMTDSFQPSRRALLGGALCATTLLGCASKPQVQSRSVAIPGGQLHVEQAGSLGSERAVLLLHGFTLDTRMWDDQFLPLAAKARVIRCDLRGFGRSTLPAAPYVHADDLAALLAALGVKKAQVVGLSAGGRVGIDLALKHPALVERLALLDTFIGGHVPSAGYRDSFAAIIAKARGGDVPGAKLLWLAHPLFAPANEQPLLAERLSLMVRWYSGFHWTQPNPEQPLAPPAVQRLGELKLPVLGLTGERDIEDVHAQARLLGQGVKGIVQRVIPGVGHMSNMEAPEAVNRELLAFLG